MNNQISYPSEPVKTVRRTGEGVKPSWLVEKQQKLETIIKSRLTLGACQRKLNSFGLTFPTLEKIKHPNFLKTFAGWDNERQQTFIYELGGEANQRRTKAYLDCLIREFLTKE